MGELSLHWKELYVSSAGDADGSGTCLQKQRHNGQEEEEEVHQVIARN